MSYQKIPNSLPSLCFAVIPSRQRQRWIFQTLQSENSTSDPAITVRSHKFEVTLPSHRHGPSRALFSWAGYSMGRYSGLSEPQATLWGRFCFNQGLLHNSKALKAPKAVQTSCPVCPQSQEQPWAFDSAQIPTRTSQHKQPSKPNAFCTCVTSMLFPKMICRLSLHSFLPIGEFFFI